MYIGYCVESVPWITYRWHNKQSFENTPMTPMCASENIKNSEYADCVRVYCLSDRCGPLLLFRMDVQDTSIAFYLSLKNTTFCHLLQWGEWCFVYWEDFRLLRKIGNETQKVVITVLPPEEAKGRHMKTTSNEGLIMGGTSWTQKL
jgi:hypothetical protein